MFSQNKPFLEKDRGIVKRVLKGVQLKRPAEVQSALIRRHFLELTQTFMIPLERYIAGLMPLAKNISPYRSAPRVGPFVPDDFLASLSSCGPQLTSTLRGDWAGLYKRFFKVRKIILHTLGQDYEAFTAAIGRLAESKLCWLVQSTAQRS